MRWRTWQVVRAAGLMPYVQMRAPRDLTVPRSQPLLLQVDSQRDNCSTIRNSTFTHRWYVVLLPLFD